MERILNYTISAADEGMIVLDFLRKQGFSRHILTAMKADREALSLNGQKAGGRTVLSCGESDFSKPFPPTASSQRL